MDMTLEDTEVPIARARPAKSFFVEMITRDISLEDCIMDLIDNSIDAAWQKEGGRPMDLNDKVRLDRYEVKISLSAQSFSITDNCGGMTVNDAEDYAFHFGNSDLTQSTDYSIGVYGIGMKRAAFKLGKRIRIYSTFEDESGATSAFAVPIDVRDWMRDSENWDFEIHDAKPHEEPGVDIYVSNLNTSVKNRFKTAAFLAKLRRTIARDYTFHLNRGLSISVNDEIIKGWNIELSYSKQFKPVRSRFNRIVYGSDVSVEILAGMANQPPSSIDPNEKDRRENTFGWYIVCNGRVVLAADKSSVSGWGLTNCPRWHYQYSGFLGIVIFTCRDANVLPLTTTKRSIDESSGVFLEARRKMIRITRDWIDYTNRRKQNKDEVEALEEAAKRRQIADLPMREKLRVPSISGKVRSDTTTVSYQVTKTRLKELAIELGDRNMANYLVGEKSFDYTYRRLVGD